jgi:uncharacterized damage-inducible protein DinB
VEGNPEALEELRRLGIARVPAVAMGDRAAHGWNPPAYAALLGVEYRAPAKLAPTELARRLDRILAATERLIAPLPEAPMDHKPPQRDRTLRDLAYHVFRLSLAYVEAMDRGRLAEAGLQEGAPADLRDGPAVARYGALVRGRVAGWVEGASPSEYARVIDVSYGPQSGHDLLERTTWHAAQHLRQLHALVQGLGLTPAEPLPMAELEGLPLPAGLW